MIGVASTPRPTHCDQNHGVPSQTRPLRAMARGFGREHEQGNNHLHVNYTHSCISSSLILLVRPSICLWIDAEVFPEDGSLVFPWYTEKLERRNLAINEKSISKTVITSEDSRVLKLNLRPYHSFPAEILCHWHSLQCKHTAFYIILVFLKDCVTLMFVFGRHF